MMRSNRKRRIRILVGLAFMSCLLGFLFSMMPQSPEAVFAQGNSGLDTGADTVVIPADATTDRVPQQLQAGQSLYIQNCGSCHIALPPAVFPTQTWDQLLRDPSHYGAVLDPIPQPQQSWVRRYLIFASRLLQDGESTPYRFRQSRYFKLLHYQVDLPTTVTSNTCINCHAKAPEFNFRE